MDCIDLKRFGLEPLILKSNGESIFPVSNNPIFTEDEIHEWSDIYPDSLNGIRTGVDNIICIHLKGEHNSLSKNIRTYILSNLGKTFQSRFTTIDETFFIFRVTNSLSYGFESSRYSDGTSESFCDILSREEVPIMGAYKNAKSRIASSAIRQITQEQANDIVSTFEKYANETGIQIKGTALSVIDKLSKFSNTVDANIKLVAKSVHSKYNGSNQGLMVLTEWIHPTELTTNEIKHEWLECSDSEINLHENIETDDESIYSEFLKRYVLIVNGQFIGDLDSNNNESVLSLRDLKVYSSHLVVQSDNFVGGKQSKKKVKVIDKWLADSKKKTAWDFHYLPTNKGTRVITPSERTKKYWNRYIPTRAQYTNDYGNIDVFKNHIEYLFGNDDDVNWFTNWLAHLIQRPHERPTTHVLHMSPYTGTGRGWLVKLMYALVGDSNHKITNIQLMSDEAGFSGFLDETTLCTIAETNDEKHGVFGVSDRLRHVFSEPKQHVNRKYGLDGTIDVFTRFFMMSNHMDALAIGVNERRVSVFENLKPSKSLAYYAELNRELTNPKFINGVYSYLTDFEISDDLLFDSFKNKARKKLVDLSMSITEKEFFKYKENAPVIFTADQIVDTVKKSIQVGTGSIFRFDQSVMDHLLVHHTFFTADYNNQKVHSFTYKQYSQEEIESYLDEE